MGDGRPRAPGPAGIRPQWSCAAGRGSCSAIPGRYATRGGRCPHSGRCPRLAQPTRAPNHAERRPAAHRASLR
jgi:hypothetical protein